MIALNAEVYNQLICHDILTMSVAFSLFLAFACYCRASVVEKPLWPLIIPGGDANDMVKVARWVIDNHLAASGRWTLQISHSPECMKHCHIIEMYYRSFSKFCGKCVRPFEEQFTAVDGCRECLRDGGDVCFDCIDKVRQLYSQHTEEAFRALLPYMDMMHTRHWRR